MEPQGLFVTRGIHGILDPDRPMGSVSHDPRMRGSVMPKDTLVFTMAEWKQLMAPDEGPQIPVADHATEPAMTPSTLTAWSNDNGKV